MTQREFTDIFIKKLTVEKRTDYVDTRETGLTLRVTPNGHKSFSIRVRDSQGRLQRVTLGNYPDLPLREARSLAIDERRAIRVASDNVNKARKLAALPAPGVPTLEELLGEYEIFAAPTHRTWRRSARGLGPEARNRILCVFSAQMHLPVIELTLQNFVDAMGWYKPRSGKSTTANGQVSRARAYLMPVMDWAANRGAFRKLGSGRPTQLAVVDLHDTYDPAINDPTILGQRDRILSQNELERILPLLIRPAPKCLEMRTPPDLDFRPIALRFMLITLARREEVVEMCWKDLDMGAKVWNKLYVKTTRGLARKQSLRLSDTAMALLRSMSSAGKKHPDDLVFPNSKGGKLGNWPRIATAIQKCSETTGWHRHDLRRTSATLLEALGVSDRVITRIMGQKATSKDQSVSKALEHYLVDQEMTAIVEDPQRLALERLAKTLDHIERKGM